MPKKKNLVCLCNKNINLLHTTFLVFASLVEIKGTFQIHAIELKKDNSFLRILMFIFRTNQE